MNAYHFRQNSQANFRDWVCNTTVHFNNHPSDRTEDPKWKYHAKHGLVIHRRFSRPSPSSGCTTSATSGAAAGSGWAASTASRSSCLSSRWAATTWPSWLTPPWCVGCPRLRARDLNHCVCACIWHPQCFACVFCQSRLQESLELFTSVCNNGMFKNTTLVSCVSQGHIPGGFYSEINFLRLRMKCRSGDGLVSESKG